ncbi:MAG: TnsA endonuclease N-terminal domain-containing protein [Polyangiales bacterium]
MPVREIRSKQRGVTGRYFSWKAGRTVAHESILERNLFLLLDGDPRVRTFEEQPCRIEFEGPRGKRRYTPDARVEYVDGAVELVEVKYDQDLGRMSVEQRADLELAFDAARAFCTAKGWTFRLRTNAEIGGPLLERANRLNMHGRAPAALPTVGPRVLDLVECTPGITLGELVGRLGDGGAQSCALHLVWRGELRDDPMAPPDLETRLFRGRAP